MKTTLRIVLAEILIGGLLLVPGTVSAGETGTETAPVTFAPVPVQYAFVDGDMAKFQNHKWMKGDYNAGADNSTAEYKLPKGVTLSMEGSGLVPQNDFGAKTSITKENLGFVNFDFKQFRRYYDTTGGVYDRFATLRHNELDKGLHMDIGHLGVDTGITIKNWPHLGFEYDRDYRLGAKSRLSWGGVTEGAILRYIFPSYQEINQSVDTFAIKADHTIGGYKLKADQRWELFRADTSRWEQWMATTGVAADNKRRLQHQEPSADLMTTTVGAERWFKKDKVFVSSGYRYAQMKNKEIESIFEFDAAGRLFNNANAKSARNSIAHNNMEDNSWVGNAMWTPWHSLSLIAKLKGDVYRNLGFSTNPMDTNAGVPNGGIDTTEISNLSNKIGSVAESVSVRFTGIPHTALYSEMELQEIGNRRYENRLSVAGQAATSANENYTNLVNINSYRQMWTIGGNFAPWYFVNTTADVRIRRENDDYDYIKNSPPTGGELFRAFFDSLKINTNEFKTRTTLRLVKWLQPAFRYQFQEKDFYALPYHEPVYVTTRTISNTYTYDLMYQPLADLMTMISFSRQTIKTVTPAHNSARTMGVPPTYNTNVNMWMFSADYALRPDLILTGSLDFSRAPNFNDYSTIGLPLGVDYNQIDLNLGVRWALNKRITLEPKYSYYHYNPNQNVEYGKYDAHVISLEMLLPWG
ncbi:MAG: hypothetical protein HZC17_03995 [Candidatus Omnitrophica bacterium]|nr:hypothetical protein [Candidatus Omnitrophota bacterium]